MTSYYELLGLSPQATIDEIRRAFRTIAKQHHPDTPSGADAKMRLLNEAYDTLKDPQRRQQYDRLLFKPHPASSVLTVVDPFRFKADVLHPLDHRLTLTLVALEASVKELAYDLYDDTYIARFAATVERAETALAEAHDRLFSAEWPASLASGLNLYRQGIRQIQDAIEDFGRFSLTLDADELVEGQSLLRWAVEMLDEARESLGIA